MEKEREQVDLEIAQLQKDFVFQHQTAEAAWKVKAGRENVILNVGILSHTLVASRSLVFI